MVFLLVSFEHLLNPSLYFSEPTGSEWMLVLTKPFNKEDATRGESR